MKYLFDCGYMFEYVGVIKGGGGRAFPLGYIRYFNLVGVANVVYFIRVSPVSTDSLLIINWLVCITKAWQLNRRFFISIYYWNQKILKIYNHNFIFFMDILSWNLYEIKYVPKQRTNMLVILLYFKHMIWGYLKLLM